MSVVLIVKDSFMNCLYLLVSRYQIVFYPFSDFYITDVVFQFDIFFFRIVQFSRYKMVGLGRLELPTSRLSGVRSNLLSYRPLNLSFLPISSSLFINHSVEYKIHSLVLNIAFLELDRKSCVYKNV